jgi:hypothetical protein
VLWMSNFDFTHWLTAHWSLCITDDTTVDLYDVLLLLTCKAISVQPCIGSEGSRRLSPRFQDNRHTKLESLLTQRIGRFYPPGIVAGTHFCERLTQPYGHSAAGRIMSIKNSSNTIGNRTRNLSACSVLPQPSSPCYYLYLYLQQ